MPNLSHDKAIEEYWEQVKHQYPNLTFEQFQAACKSPFKAIKDWIRSDEFPYIFVKHLGKIRVTETKLYDKLSLNEYKFKNNQITEQEYLDTKKFLIDYLEEIKRENEEVELIDDEQPNEDNQEGETSN